MDKPMVLPLAEVQEIAADAERFGRPLGSLWVLRLCATVEFWRRQLVENMEANAAEHARLREDAENWRTLMSEAAECLKEPEHLARVARIEAAIAEEAEERRLLLEIEEADREWRTRLSVPGDRLDAARAAMDAFRARQKEAGQ